MEKNIIKYGLKLFRKLLGKNCPLWTTVIILDQSCSNSGKGMTSCQLGIYQGDPNSTAVQKI